MHQELSHCSTRQVRIIEADQAVTVRFGCDEIDFNLNTQFQYLMHKTVDRLHGRRLRLDLKEARSISSSGLGLLLMLRESLGPQADIHLLVEDAAVRRNLGMARFQRFFTIH